MIVDANGMVLGRLASMVAKRLLEEDVVVVNAGMAVISGSKEAIMEEYEQRWRRGTHRKGPFFPRKPDQILKRAVRGMLPYQKRGGRKAYRRLRVYTGVPTGMEMTGASKVGKGRKEGVDYVTLGQITKWLGGK